MEAARQNEPVAFDREVTFKEAFGTEEGREFLARISEIIGAQFLLMGNRGELEQVPSTARELLDLPRPALDQFPIKPTAFKTPNGNSSVAIPLFYEGEAMALFISSDRVIKEKVLAGKVKQAAGMIEWFIYVVHQRRMIAELHDHTQESSYKELLLEHQRVVDSEKKYRELAETLEQKVEERKKELENAQRQLLQQEKMASIGQLAAGVAHEINNPTGFVYSNLQTLKNYHRQLSEVLNLARTLLDSAAPAQKNKFSAKWKQEDIDYIINDLTDLDDQSIKGTERIIRIVRGLSRFSHVNEDQQESFNLNELLDSTVELLWNEIKHKVELVKEYGKVPNINGNPNQISQVFVNLIMNALQAVDKKGTITLGTRLDNGAVEIKIIDTGSGITQENLNKVFDPFFTTKPVGQGTGLGLAISYQIIKAHGGDIKIESELWKGTTFTITLPVGE